MESRVTNKLKKQKNEIINQSNLSPKREQKLHSRLVNIDNKLNPKKKK